MRLEVIKGYELHDLKVYLIVNRQAITHNPAYEEGIFIYLIVIKSLFSFNSS